MREHEHEPLPGLPESLPQGETVLWQGAPDWWAMARRSFRIRGLALYFALLAGWRAVILADQGASAGAVLLGSLWLVLLGLSAVSLVLLFSYASARTTLYTVTDRRVVMRVGVALPMTVNIPFAALRSAGLRRHADCGDVLLQTEPGRRVSFVALWPHLRFLRWTRPEPVLRALPDAEAAGAVLARALAASAGSPVPVQAEVAPAARPPAIAAAA